jgi:hypothetical protein
MWYTVKEILIFRDNKIKGYRGGYAESMMVRIGIERIVVGLNISINGRRQVPYVINVKGVKPMFYNGNDLKMDLDMQ